VGDRFGHADLKVLLGAWRPAGCGRGRPLAVAWHRRNLTSADGRLRCRVRVPGQGQVSGYGGNVADPVQLLNGDVVLVRRHGAYFAVVTNAGARRVAVEPCDPAIKDRIVRPSEIDQVYRPVGRPGDSSGCRLRPSPRQLRLDDPRTE